MSRPLKNMLPFTDRSIRSLKPGPFRVDYMCPDVKVKGFGVRVYPSGAKTFFVRYRQNGGLHRFNLGSYGGTTLKDARTAAEGIIGRLAKGEDPQGEREAKRAATSFGEFAETYLTLYAKPRMRRRSYGEEERVIRHDLLPAWRRCPVTEIRRRDVAAVLDTIRARGAAVQANRTRGVASRIFAFALEREIVEYNPVAGLRRPTKEQSRDRVLSEEEIRLLWRVWEKEASVTSALSRMLLLSGQGVGAVRRMRWADLHERWWIVPAKYVRNQETDRVQLTKPMLELLDSLREVTGREEWVFASPWKKNKPISPVSTAVTSALFRMLLLSGQRVGEVLRMRWADLHGAWWIVPAKYVKNKRTHRVYLTKAMQELLESLREVTGREEWVFASPRKKDKPMSSLSTAKKRFRSAAGFSDWRPHDLRRTVATHMGRPPLSLAREIIRLVLNHSDGSMTAIYDRAAREPEVEMGLRLWGERLEEIVRGEDLQESVVGFERQAQ